MKNHLFFIFFIFSCAPEKTAKPLSPSKSIALKVSAFEARDSLFLIASAKDSATKSFYMTGQDISQVKIVGVIHNDSMNSRGLGKREEVKFDFFWDMYFYETQKNPAEMILGIETTGLDHKKTQRELGSRWKILKPSSFITPHLFFDLGVNQIIKANQRDLSLVSLNRYQKSFSLFYDRGGVMDFGEISGTGFPIVRVAREPDLSNEDVKWLREEWYTDCYLPDRQFENYVFNMAIDGYVSVVGAAHALRIYRETGIKIAIVADSTFLNLIAMTLAQNEYFLKVINQRTKKL